MSTKKELFDTLTSLNLPYKKWWSKDKLQQILREHNLRSTCQWCECASQTFMVINDPPFEDDCLDYSGDEQQRYCEKSYLCKVCAKKSGGWIQIEDVDEFVL